jgi:hypothetical protein
VFLALFEFASGLMAEAGAGATKIVGAPDGQCQFVWRIASRHTRLRRLLFRHSAESHSSKLV